MKLMFVLEVLILITCPATGRCTPRPAQPSCEAARSFQFRVCHCVVLGLVGVAPDDVQLIEREVVLDCVLLRVRHGVPQLAHAVFADPLDPRLPPPQSHLAFGSLSTSPAVLRGPRNPLDVVGALRRRWRALSRPTLDPRRPPGRRRPLAPRL